MATWHWPTVVDGLWGAVGRVNARTFDSRRRNLGRRHAPGRSTSSQRFLAERLEGVPAFASKYALLRYSLSRMPPAGEILEFGVYRGATLAFIAGHAPPGHPVVGFDSFEGLPQPWGEQPQGSFRLRRPPELGPDVRLVVGRFERTLGGFLGPGSGPVAFAHVDCDLYESARCVLGAITPHLVDGSIVQFDEFFNYPGWEQGEARALEEWARATEIGYEFLGFCRFDSQVAVRIVRAAAR